MGNALISKMPSTAETGYGISLRGAGKGSEVKSSPGQSTESKAFMPRRNLITLFDDFSRFAGDVAVVQTRGYRREKLTHVELSAHALFWSHALGGRGIGPGDRVLLWGPNSAEWVACFWGILLRGAVVVPMDSAA